MRNLKRVLSLALAVVMVIGMMVMTTGAADFADKAEIKNVEAVEIMAALGILEGDGTNFNPAQNVTRAEMAKMITYIYLGDVDVSAFKAATTDLTDISGHWAEGYIKFCYNQGIISGHAGLFNPNDTVTAVQAAKMLLVTIGYNADVRGYVGESWMINTMRDALKAGFFKDVAATGNDVLTRDEAALMIYNAVQAETVEVTQTLNVTTGNISYSYTGSGTDLLDLNFDALSKQAYITGVSYDREKGLYTYTLNTDGTTLGTDNTPAITIDACVHGQLKSATNYTDLFGQKVTIVYKDDANEHYPVYGIYGAGDVVVSGTLGEIIGATDPADIATTDTKIKVKGTEYSLTKTAADVDLFTFNTTAASETLDNITSAKYIEFAAIDNSDDGKIDTIVTYPVTAEKVTYAGSASITAASNSYVWDKDKGMHKIGGTFYKLPEVTKGDYLIVDQFAVGMTARTATVAEVLTGEVTATATGKVELDGTWYPTAGATLSLGKEYACQMVNGYVVAGKEVSSDSEDILYVITSEAGTAELRNGTAKVMFADGTTKVIEYKGIGNNRNDVSALSSDTMYTFEVKDGVYSVKVVNGDNKAGFTGYSSTYNSSTGTGNYEYTAATQTDYAKLNGTAIADDAVIFLKSGTSSANYKWSVISGATLKTYTDTDTNAAVTMLTKATDGQNAVKVAVMMVNGAFGVDNAYAYITSDVYLTKVGPNTYGNYTAWTAKGEVTVKDTVSTRTKGTWVVLNANSDGTYTSTTYASAANGAKDVMAPVAITGYNATDKTITALALNGTALANAKLYGAKTQIIYVNTTTKQGVEGGEIALSERLADGSYVANAYLVYDCNADNTNLKSISAIIFDVNNDLVLTNTLGTGTAGYVLGSVTAAISGEDVTNTAVAKLDAVKAEGTPTNGSAVDTVTIEVKANAATSITGNGITLTCGGVTVTVGAKATIASGDVIAELVVPAQNGAYTVTAANAS